MSEFYRATPNIPIASMGLAVGPSGLALPVWYDADAWTFDGASLSQSPVSGAGPTYLVTDTGLFLITEDGTFLVTSFGTGSGGTVGFCGIAVDDIGGFWMAQHYGGIVYLAADMTVDTFQTPSGQIFTGIDFVTPYEEPYMMGANGSLWTLTAASGVQQVTISGAKAFGSSPARGAVASGHVVYTILPAVPSVGSFTLSSALGGVSGTIATPMLVPASLAVSSGLNALAVGGWNYALIGAGASGITGDSQVAINMLAAVGTGVALYENDGHGNWTNHQSLPLTHAALDTAWAPNGVSIFATDPGLAILQYSAGSISVVSDAATAANHAAFTTDSTKALVIDHAGNLIREYAFSSTWAPSGTIALAGPLSVIGLGATSAAVGNATGISFLGYSGGNWSITSTTPSAFPVDNMVLDGSGIIFAAGHQSTSGYVSALVSGAVTTTATWNGSSVGIVDVNQQIIVADPTAGLLRIFGLVGGILTQLGSIVAPAGVQAIGSAGSTVFAATASEIAEYNLTAPYTLEPVLSGAVAVHVSGVWDTAILGVGHQPTAVSFNPSGTVTAVTLENEVYTISLSGTVLSSGTVAQFSGQPQGTPIGMSYLRWWNSHLYSSSSLNDSLVEIL